VKQFYGFKAQVDGAYREETLFGKDYIVIPVVALVEGVIQGMTAEGPELALAEEFGRFPAGWNGRPLTMSHPVDKKGNPVSANSPQTLTEWQVGQLFNTRLVGGKLLTEAWVEVERAKGLNANSKSTLKALQDGEMIEVSTGYFAQLEETEGTYGKGKDAEEYVAIQRNIVPDHLALLPQGVKGACSIEDGCGAPRMNAATFRANADCSCGGDTQTTATTTEVQAGDVPVVEAGKPMKKDGEDEKAAGKKKQGNPKAYAAGDLDCILEVIANSYPDGMLDMDARKLVTQALRKLQQYSYVLGMTPKYVIYEQYNQFSGTYSTYQRSYTVKKDGSVSLGDDITEVNLVTQILPVAQASPSANAQPSDGAKPEDNKEQTMTTQAAPAPSSAPAATEPKLTTHKAKDAAGNEVTMTLNEKGEVVETKVTLVAQEQPKPSTLADLLANADPALRESIQSGVKLHTQRRETLVAQLKSTNRCTFTDDQLKAFSLDQLEQLAKLADIPQNFQGVALPVAQVEDTDAAPAAPLVFEYGAPAAKTTETKAAA
jgi:hypothetical protein